MFVPSNAIPCGEWPTAKVPTGPHVGALLALQAARTLLQTPASRDANGARGARQSFTAGGHVLHGPTAQSLSCAQLVGQTLPLQPAYGEQLTAVGVEQLPAPSQVAAGVADPAVHEAAPQLVPAAASMVPQVLFVQVLTTQGVAWAGQSLGMRHATQLPLPSQTPAPASPPSPASPSLQVVSAGAGAVPQQPASHVGMTQAVVVATQSAGLVQLGPASQTTGMPPVLLLELTDAAPPVPLLELEATVPLLELEATVL
jgi:hypothetical protein